MEIDDYEYWGYGGYMSSNTTNQGTGSKSWDCHKGNVFVFEMDGVSVYGGGSSHDADYNSPDIVIDLSDYLYSWKGRIPESWQCRAEVGGPEILSLKITDMRTPAVGKGFWYALWEDLKARAPCKVLVMCMGGHGRTGLVLTCLLMAAGVDTKEKNQMIWLRENYCDKAIETNSQLAYCGDMWDIPYEIVPPTKSTYTASYSTCDWCGVKESGVSKTAANNAFRKRDFMECVTCWKTLNDKAMPAKVTDGKILFLAQESFGESLHFTRKQKKALSKWLATNPNPQAELEIDVKAEEDDWEDDEDDSEAHTEYEEWFCSVCIEGCGDNGDTGVVGACANCPEECKNWNICDCQFWCYSDNSLNSYLTHEHYDLQHDSDVTICTKFPCIFYRKGDEEGEYYLDANGDLITITDISSFQKKLHELTDSEYAESFE